MKSTIENVKEFHDTSGANVLPSPAIPASSRIDLRLSLLEEELKELTTAAWKGDLVGVADALVDLQYVLTGTVLEFGLQDIFQDLFSEVHRSNMSKFCDTTLQAKQSAEFYLLKKGVDAYYKKVGKKFVIRRYDDKILKGLSYSEPNLRDIVRKHIKKAELAKK